MPNGLQGKCTPLTPESATCAHMSEQHDERRKQGQCVSISGCKNLHLKQLLMNLDEQTFENV